MSLALILWPTAALIILGAVVIPIVLQLRAERRAVKHHAELKERLDEQRAETAANRERLERRTQEVREANQESLELKRKELALRQEQGASLQQLVAMHEALLAELRGQRRS